ncbi:MAG TPA: Zn-ribbon domain-containing OB-fold protein [Allosphingosinicella sp.]|nr:Zn-ribbon domain-containing OB-fold protein [Allosphingosinicella sp.]HKY81607.1 Zn-ribbon domain-containing OB-fold protein [Sphingobium sp.]
MTMDINSILEIERPAPGFYDFSAPFWEATREKKLVIQYCRKTGKPQFYPRPTSLFTGRRDLEWREVSGKGEIFTFAIGWRGFGQFQGREPYVFATVTIDEGVNIIGNIVNCEIDDLAIGMRVKPYWAPLTDGRHQLMFEPDRGE